MACRTIILVFTFLVYLGLVSATPGCTESYITSNPWNRHTNIKIQCLNIQLPLKFLISGNLPLKEVWLKIGESNLSYVEANSFKSYSMVTELDLSHNNITNLGQDAFAGLSSLRKLFLSKNSLIKLEVNVFNTLQQLRVLDVSMNKIKSLNLYFLTDTIHLTYLNLSKNSLTYFDDILLGQNHYIAQLNLSDNNISEIILNRSSHRIGDLDVSKNELSVMDICLPGLLSMNVSFNRIKYVIAGKCSINMTILNLDISHNLVDEISVKNVSKLFTLTYLNIGYNNMSLIPNYLFGNMTKLSYLDLSYNKIVNLEYGIFDRLNSLKYLDLSYNKLKSITRYFYALKNLITLKINNNEITSIYSNLTFNDLSSLSNIYLDGNKFECKQILEMLESLRQKKVKIDYGTYTNEPNVFGISCYNNNLNTEIKNDLTDFIKNIVSSKKNGKTNEDNEFRRTVMYDYFNKEFLNSNFYKYLENFKSKNEDTLQLLKSEIENSKLNKFLDYYITNENSTIEFSKQIEQYLEELELDLETKVTVLNNITNTQSHSSKNSSTTYYTEMFVVILLLLILIIVKFINTYLMYTRKKSYKKEEHELPQRSEN